jgi:hypothetical protein
MSTDQTKSTKETPHICGFKRSYREFLNQNADHKNIVLDVELIYIQNERNIVHNKSSSSAESVKEERTTKKDVGFGFKY